VRALLRRPGLVLAALLLADAALLLIGVARAWDAQVLLRVPHGDAAEYWSWAGAIAEGHWVGDTPFLSAPLYPYLLGLLRACGGGLPAVLVLQVLLRAATAWLLYRAAARTCGGAGPGLAAAALFLVLVEPAFYATRILNSSLQLALLAALLVAAPATEERRTPARLGGFGLLFGLNALANPPMLLLLPLLPAWLGWRSRAAWRASAWVALGAAVALAPSAWHNWMATRHAPGGGEFILISAQAGITYAHGNAPGAIGLYQPLAGVSQERTAQNRDAYELAQKATGRASWRVTDRHFRDQGLTWVREHPAEAFTLHLRKFGYLMFGQNYGDLYNLTLERSDGALPDPLLPHFACVQTPWILPLALLGGFALLRARGRRAAPELALLLLPCLVVIVFWFSPRYRLPLIPAACVLAPFAITSLTRTPRTSLRLGWLAFGLALPVLGRLGFGAQDVAEAFRPEFEYQLGHLLRREGRPEEALPRYRAALDGGYAPPASHEGIGRCLVEMGRAAEAAGDAARARELWMTALEEFNACLSLNPRRHDVRVVRGSLLAQLGRRQEALADLREAQRQYELAGQRDAAAAVRSILADLERGS
jgi:4-amino-4-deoxy-L-arabinose transferase-like glycosyltransferase